MKQLTLTLLLLLLSAVAQAQGLPGGQHLGSPNLGILFNHNNKPKSAEGTQYDMDRDSIQSKIDDLGGQVFNVMAYGAACDGVTDDSTEIQAAENAADNVGGTVFIPPGTCVIDDSIIVSSGVTIAGAGPGSILQGSSNLSSEPHIESEVNPENDGARDVNITIRDLTIDGQNSSANSMGILLRSVVDASVESVYITDVTFDCVYIGSGTTKTVRPLRNSVRGIHCVNAGRNGIAVTAGVQLVIADNHIDSPALHGIDLELESSADLMVDNVSITGNVIENADASTTYCGIALTADTSGQIIRNVTISGNTISDPGRGICFRQTTNLVVDGNTIRSSSEDGIHTVTGNDAPTNTVISNNNIIDAAQYGFRWTRTTPVLFSGNRIYNSVNHGVAIANSTGSVITGNVVDVVGGVDECMVFSDTTDTVVSGNSLYNCPDEGIKIGGSVATLGTTITGNVIEADGKCVSDNEGGAGVDYTSVIGNRYITCSPTTDLTGANSVAMDLVGGELTVAEGVLRVSEKIRADTAISVGADAGSGEQATFYRAAGATTIVDIDNGATPAYSRLQFSARGEEQGRIEYTEGTNAVMSVGVEGICVGGDVAGSLCGEETDCTGGGDCDFADVIIRGGLPNHDIVIDGDTGDVTIDQDLAVTELSASGVTGTGKVVCVKSDGDFGVCSDQPGGSGTCTCN